MICVVVALLCCFNSLSRFIENLLFQAYTTCISGNFFVVVVYLNPPFPSNYILSISASSGLIALLSTGSK